MYIAIFSKVSSKNYFMIKSLNSFLNYEAKCWICSDDKNYATAINIECQVFPIPFRNYNGNLTQFRRRRFYVSIKTYSFKSRDYTSQPKKSIRINI